MSHDEGRNAPPAAAIHAMDVAAANPAHFDADQDVIVADLGHGHVGKDEMFVLFEYEGFQDVYKRQILYSPRAFRVLGDDVTGVNLSPLGVHPLYQGQGIGGALTEAGDSEARRLGYPFSILLGHKDYYPRLGYRQNAYGFSGMTLPASALGSASSAPLETRKPLPEDTEALMLSLIHI